MVILRLYASVIDIIHNFLAPLTENEVAEIDAAGAKGPPVTLRSMKLRLFKLARRKRLLTDYLALLALFILFGCYYLFGGMQMFARWI